VRRAKKLKESEPEFAPQWWVIARWDDHALAEVRARGVFEREKLALRPENSNPVGVTLELRHGADMKDVFRVEPK
jgi:hypothetical protein